MTEITDADRALAREAVARAHEAFAAMSNATGEQISGFFRSFADRLADEKIWSAIGAANETDVAAAQEKGRGVTRLVASTTMRDAMIEGLIGWAKAQDRRGEVIERRETPDWSIERRRAPLGVVAFVFEGRPNVFADGVGVLRGGNTSVMRIGSDALRTAEAIEANAVAPALADAGLPDGAVVLMRSPSHGSAHALFMQPQVRLAVARGSGPATKILGEVASRHGIPVSLHGTGGAWMYLAPDAPHERAHNAIVGSVDRKVCNTLNTIVIQRRDAHRFVPLVIAAMKQRDPAFKLHVANGSHHDVPADLPNVDVIPLDELATEWEWESTPEVSLVCANDDDEAIELINTYSPHFVASLITADAERFRRFYDLVDAPYISDGFTRWVDGQWAWDRPELGLSNWELGRIIGRSGILSPDDVFTVRDVFLDGTGNAQQHR